MAAKGSLPKAAEEEEEVLYRVVDGVAIISLNRPLRLNALTRSLSQAFVTKILRASASRDVSVIILTGQGRGFCSGADLKDRTSHAPEEGVTAGEMTYQTITQYFKPMILAVRNCQKLVIGAINGGAVGAGAALALACDLRVMSSDSYLLLAFINIGLVPDAGISYFLSRQVGYSKALELALGGEPISAQGCLSLGLTNKVVEPEKLLSGTLEWAKKLASKPRFASKLTKEAIHFSTHNALSDTIEYEARLQQFCRENSDHTEGVVAFLEKRKPSFHNQDTKIPGGILAARL